MIAPPTQSDSLDALLEEATQHHLAGRLDRAEAVYHQVLAVRPGQADALHRLGVLTWQNAKPQEGLELVGRAIEINSREPRYHCSRGQILAELGSFPQAIESFQIASKLKPAMTEAMFGLGLALQATKRQDAAIGVYRKLISHLPNHVEAHNNLGNALQSCGHLHEAIAEYRLALNIQPDYVEALNNLGGALHAAGQTDEAIPIYNRALAIRADFAPLHINLGNALASQGRLEDALLALRFAVQLQPQLAEAWYNLANVLRDQNQLHNAIVAYTRAVELRPDYVDAHINLGNALQTLGDFWQASSAYLGALAVRPDHETAQNNFSNALRMMGEADKAIEILRNALRVRPDFHIAWCNLGNVLKDTGRLDEAIASYRRAIEIRRQDAVTHSNLVYSVHFHPDYDGNAILHENLRFNVLHAQKLTREIRSARNDRKPDRRLRIGYVSPDFREHCQSLFTIPLLSNHDPKQFEIFCYASLPRADFVTDRIAGLVDQWRNVTSHGDERVAQIVREDQIDILVDLTMHMSNGRPLLFARKPAPVQVAYLAYPGTTGLSAIDYRLTDPYLDPAENDCFYSERSIRLADTFWCYDPLTSGPEPGELPARKNGHITFGCLNNFCKVNDGTLAIWAKILSAMPDSHLILLCPPGSHRQHLLERLGIAESRIEFAEFRPRQRYLELYKRIDLGLETFPYNGHTTSLDSFWMGVPVPTRVGRTAVGRAGWSQLSNLGLTELAAQTDDQFVEIVLKLARDLDRLAELRATLRVRLESSPLMDAPRFARNVEQAYRQMWKTWCNSTGNQ